jgi:ABC-2 type transport system ATP-binding protein
VTSDGETPAVGTERDEFGRRATSIPCNPGERKSAQVVAAPVATFVRWVDPTGFPTTWGETAMGHSGDHAIEAEGLVKVFDQTSAVDGIDLAVPPGTVFGVLGPNGAGKTTMIRMLATLLTPTAGWARVLGHDIVREADKVRSSVSLTGQFASVDDELNGVENLVLLGRLYGFPKAVARERADELLEAFGLTEAADKLVRDYSGGMRRRLDIASSIVITPELLFLDEPTTGLDPRSRNQVWDIVRTLVGAGTTVLLTTQYLEEADQLADEIAIIDHGKVIAKGTSAELKSRVGSEVLHVRLADPTQRSVAEDVLSDLLAERVEPATEPALLVARASGAEHAADAVASLARAGIHVSEFSLGNASLDEVFLALTGHPADQTADDTEEDAA